MYLFEKNWRQYKKYEGNCVELNGYRGTDPGFPLDKESITITKHALT